MFKRLAVAVASLLLLVPTAYEEANAQLPVHTIEGVGGGSITPIAMLISSDRPPAVSAALVSINDKNLQTVTITQSFLRRVEFGYAVTRLHLGDLPRDILAATAVGIDRDELFMHQLNGRVLLVEENGIGPWFPAIVAGVAVKFNSAIDDINTALGGALETIGFDNDVGVDVTVTGSKIIPNVGKRPLIVSAGLRVSRGAWNGYLGFADDYTATFEGSLIYLAAPIVSFAYEFRQMPNAYSSALSPLIGQPDSWHAVDVIFLVKKRFTVTGIFAVLGNVVNKDANAAFGIELKNEF